MDGTTRKKIMQDVRRLLKTCDNKELASRLKDQCYQLYLDADYRERINGLLQEKLVKLERNMDLAEKNSLAFNNDLHSEDRIICLENALRTSERLYNDCEN